MTPMQILRASPRLPRLRPFIQALWASEPEPGAKPSPGAREHVLPTGAMHLVFRLSGPPLLVLDGPEDLVGQRVGHALVGGARDRFYLRDVSQPTASVGALLNPGAAHALLGVPGDELSGRHTALDSLWGSDSNLALERLQEVQGLEARLDAFETLMAQRLVASFHGLHPAVARSLAPLRTGLLRVSEVARQSGHSHRHFISLFRAATGLAPKVFARVHRMDRVLGLATNPSLDWADIALEAGFADQSHLAREFGEIAGLSPQAWRMRAPTSAPRHVPR